MSVPLASTALGALMSVARGRAPCIAALRRKPRALPATAPRRCVIERGKAAAERVEQYELGLLDGFLRKILQAYRRGRAASRAMAPRSGLDNSVSRRGAARRSSVCRVRAVRMRRLLGKCGAQQHERGDEKSKHRLLP